MISIIYALSIQGHPVYTEMTKYMLDSFYLSVLNIVGSLLSSEYNVRFLK